jgi:hypothetical protein
MTEKNSTLRAYRAMLWDMTSVVFACSSRDAGWAAARAAFDAGYGRSTFEVLREVRVKRAPDLDSRRNPATHRYLAAYAEADL